MAPKRPKFTLDEKAFQDLLAAAFTVQEHLKKRKAETSPVCEECGASVAEGESVCANCVAKHDEPRPGEKMQRKWASLWEMGQEQGLWPKRSPEDEPVPEEISEADAGDRLPEAMENDLLPEHAEMEREHQQPEQDELEGQPEETGLRILPESDDLVVEPAETDSAGGGEEPPRSRLKLRIQRSDIYLVVAIAFGVMVLIWALASPSPERKTAGQHGVHLTLWERALISLGIAEAPEAPVERGNPDVRVWEDPHAALYYCPGDEQYGKTEGGRYTTQKDAQMDQFEPAFRAACE
jgi:hypothetical protein